MKAFIIFSIIFYALQLIGYFIHLSREDYPRLRSSMSVGQDALEAVFCIGLIIWASVALAI